MSTRRKSNGGSASPVDEVNVEPWRWSSESPDEVARLARLLTHRERVVECVSAGNSMGQVLPSGTPLRFRCGRSDPKLGDVVVVLAGPTDLIVHRVVGKGWGPRARGYLLTRGDNSVLCDQPVPASAVLGVVEECGRGHGWANLDPPRPRGILPTLASGVLKALMLAALAVHPRLAAWMAAGAHGVLSRTRAMGASTS
jgi:hypothetical protein